MKDYKKLGCGRPHNEYRENCTDCEQWSELVALRLQFSDTEAGAPKDLWVNVYDARIAELEAREAKMREALDSVEFLACGCDNGGPHDEGCPIGVAVARAVKGVSCRAVEAAAPCGAGEEGRRVMPGLESDVWKLEDKVRALENRVRRLEEADPLPELQDAVVAAAKVYRAAHLKQVSSLRYAYEKHTAEVALYGLVDALLAAESARGEKPR